MSQNRGCYMSLPGPRLCTVLLRYTIGNKPIPKTYTFNNELMDFFVVLCLISNTIKVLLIRTKWDWLQDVVACFFLQSTLGVWELWNLERNAQVGVNRVRSGLPVTPALKFFSLAKIGSGQGQSRSTPTFAYRPTEVKIGKGIGDQGAMWEWR
jgi:hypothetical protein